MTDEPIKSWKTLKSRYSYQDKWLRLRSDTVLLPNGTVLDPYHTIETPDWVNIVAITETDDIVLVEQYRHPVRRVLLELPAGNVDAAELPEQAARRELLEETGYGEGTWHDLGSMFPVASRFTNEVHAYLAVDVCKIAAPAPDVSESLRLREMQWSKLAADLRSGRRMIAEAAQVSSLFLMSLFVQSSHDPRLARLRLWVSETTPGQRSPR